MGFVFMFFSSAVVRGVFLFVILGLLRFFFFLLPAGPLGFFLVLGGLRFFFLSVVGCLSLGLCFWVWRGAGLWE
ncbi:hypothetical protein ACNITZ_28035, partial [Escherichia coli]